MVHIFDETPRSALRTSCERCRTQKLRCVPHPNSAAGAPCLRCVKAKLPDLCVFNLRSKTGRGASRSRKLSENGQGSASKDREKSSSSSLPGMSTFALTGVAPTFTEPSTSEHPTALPTTETLTMLDLDHVPLSSATVNVESVIPDYWQDNTTTLNTFSLDDFLDQSPSQLSDLDNYGSTDEGSCPQPMNVTQTLFSAGSTAKLGFQDLALPPPNTASLGHHQLDGFPDDRTDLLMHFVVLLTEMSSYESRLSKISGSMFHDYPIGDAIFLSHRFYDILLDNNNNNNNRNTFSSPTSRISTPDFLLSSSCFVTLVRIYSIIFDHLREYILQRPEMRSPQAFTEPPHSSLGADIHLYRGLKLLQLQPICFCSGWDPVKKAVSMLLDTLRSAEGLLGLPADSRIVDPPGTESQNEQTSPIDTNGTENTALVEEDSFDLSAHDSLYKMVRKQAVQLRAKIKTTHNLLEELCKHGSSPPPKF